MPTHTLNITFVVAPERLQAFIEWLRAGYPRDVLPMARLTRVAELEGDTAAAEQACSLQLQADFTTLTHARAASEAVVPFISSFIKEFGPEAMAMPMILENIKL